MSISESILYPSGTRQTDRKYYEAGVRGRYEGNLRVERGSVDTTTPSITFGVGFTVAKNGTGDVTVTFDPPFSTPPSVTWTPQRADTADINVISQIGDATTSTARVFRKTLGGTALDGPLNFIAVGPSRFYWT